MEAGTRADEVGLAQERRTALGLGVFQLLDNGEVAIGQGRDGERPQMLGGLAVLVTRLQTIWADAAHRGKDLAEWCTPHSGGDCKSSNVSQAVTASASNSTGAWWNAASPGCAVIGD